MQLKYGAVLGVVLGVSGLQTASTQPARCKPGPATMAAASTHVFLGTPLDVKLQKADDMYYLRVKWRVDEVFTARDGITALAVGTEIWAETACIDLEPDAATAEYSQGYCPGGRGIAMRGAQEDTEGVYTARAQTVAYLGSASTSVLDQKRVWGDASNMPFVNCEDAALMADAEIKKLTTIELGSSEPVAAPSPVQRPIQPSPKSGCSK